jgi:ABC-type sugar transport system permease subunit
MRAALPILLVLLLAAIRVFDFIFIMTRGDRRAGPR